MMEDYSIIVTVSGHKDDVDRLASEFCEHVAQDVVIHDAEVVKGHHV